MVESITMGPIGTIGVVPAGGDRTALASTPAELAEGDAEAVGESTATKLATGAAGAPDADEAQRRARPAQASRPPPEREAPWVGDRAGLKGAC